MLLLGYRPAALHTYSCALTWNSTEVAAYATHRLHGGEGASDIFLMLARAHG